MASTSKEMGKLGLGNSSSERVYLPATYVVGYGSKRRGVSRVDQVTIRTRRCRHRCKWWWYKRVCEQLGEDAAGPGKRTGRRVKRRQEEGSSRQHIVRGTSVTYQDTALCKYNQLVAQCTICAQGKEIRVSAQGVSMSP